MSQTRLGYLFGLGAYLSWGLVPLYWKLLRPAGALELLAQRVLWSAVAVAVLVSVIRGWRRVGTLLRQGSKVGLVVAAAVLIAVNWGTYIYGVNADRVVETSLGYFINPLVTVVLGVVVLGERLRPAQWAAVGIGALAVGVLTYDYGHLPVIALVLAASFGLYGLTKKRLAVPATDGLLLESGTLVLPAALFLLVLAQQGTATVGTVSPAHTALVLGSGVITVIPLLLFAGAANRIPLSAIGLLQYVAPIMQLACGVLVFHEPMPPARMAGFALVWLALVVFSGDGIRHARANLRGTRTRPAAEPVTA